MSTATPWTDSRSFVCGTLQSRILEVDCHVLLPRIFLTPETEAGSSSILHWQVTFITTTTWEDQKQASQVKTQGLYNLDPPFNVDFLFSLWKKETAWFNSWKAPHYTSQQGRQWNYCYRNHMIFKMKF